MDNEQITILIGTSDKFYFKVLEKRVIVKRLEQIRSKTILSSSCF